MVRRATSFSASQSDSASRAAATVFHPGCGKKMASTTPASRTELMPEKIHFARGEGGMKRDSSSRSPAMVSTRKPSQAGFAEEMPAVATVAAPSGRQAAPAARQALCSCGWRRQICNEAARRTNPPSARMQAPALTGAPRIQARPAAPEASGAA
jgi:hypothetical protein